MHKKTADASPARSSSAAEIPPECPMHKKTESAQGSSSPALGGPVYNVYSQEVDPTNMMPKQANQKPAPGQRKELSTHRVVSTIPKGGTEGTWVYPSPQMFYNALVRKDKAHDVTEDDMEAVVTIHNAMNERTWAEVVYWEGKLHAAENEGKEAPRLRRFMGRPHDLSPKARLKSLLGFGFPFDRHDWVVDRGDGSQNRYIIDFYFDAKAVDSAAAGVDAIYVDVRPALDSFGAVVDRLRLFPERMAAAMRRKWVFADGRDESVVPREVNMALGQRVPARGAAAAAAPPPLLLEIEDKCGKLRKALESASSEEERQKLYIGLNYCMGSVACPSEASALFAELERGAKDGQEANPEQEDALFKAMATCVMHKVAASARAAEGASAE